MKLSSLDLTLAVFWLVLLVMNVISAGSVMGYAPVIIIALITMVLTRLVLEQLTGYFGSRSMAVRSLQLAIVIFAVAILFFDGLFQTLLAMLVDAASLVAILSKDDDFEDGIKRLWISFKEKARAFSRPVMGGLRPS